MDHLLRMHAKVLVRPAWDAPGNVEEMDARALNLALKDQPRLKALDEHGRLNVTLMASTPDIDEQNEIVRVEAFASSFEAYNENPILTAYHDLKQPVGLAPAEITKAGLLQRGFISAARPDIQQLVLDGVLAFVSIGFFPIKMEWNEELDVLEHLDLEHIETALVPIPANLHTWVTVNDVKAWRAEDIARRKATPEVPAERPEPETPAEQPAAATPATPGEDAEADAIADAIADQVARVGSALAGVAGAVAGE